MKPETKATGFKTLVGLGFRVWGLGFRIWGLGSRVEGRHDRQAQSHTAKTYWCLVGNKGMQSL